MAAKISISVPDPKLLEWAKVRAEREGVSLSAVFNEAVRLARQYEARLRVLDWLGPASAMSPAREAEIRAELGEKGSLRGTRKRTRRLRKE
jgi:hypothetical protein